MARWWVTISVVWYWAASMPIWRTQVYFSWEASTDMGCIMVPATKLSQKKIHTDMANPSGDRGLISARARGTSQVRAR